MTVQEIDGWKKARILPRNVLVRQATTFETIERNGRTIGVKPGSYIIVDADGKVWHCSEETFKHSYTEGWSDEQSAR